MKVLIGLSAILLPILCLAQPVIKPLSVGDTVPDISLTHVYNYPSLSVHLSAFKGRLVILDFWSTWCLSCVEGIPKMQHLQQRFGDSLQVVLVNVYEHDTPKKVQDFFTKYTARTGTSVTLPYSLLQTGMPAYFPFQFIPHYVWISESGKVIAITSQTEVTEQNISAALAGSTLALHEKKDAAAFSATVPLLVHNNGGSADSFIYRSLFTVYIEGLGDREGVDKNDSGQISHLYMLNCAPLIMLRAAYPAEMEVPYSRLFIECRKAAMYTRDGAQGANRYTNSFCYDLTIRPSGLAQVQAYLKEDVARYLAVQVVQEQRSLLCFVLTGTNRQNLLHTKGGVPGFDDNPQSLRKYIHNSPFTELTTLLSNLITMDAYPLVDETGITGSIDLELPQNLYSLTLPELQAFLLQKGIEATLQKRTIMVTIIKDK